VNRTQVGVPKRGTAAGSHLKPPVGIVTMAHTLLIGSAILYIG